MMLKKVKELKKYARVVASKAEAKARPLARKILLGSIKLERMLENEAKKLLAEKRKNSRKRK
ncbi:MAG: hypothetical protein US31_C0017G0011 [Berkelbacteria bacterium GW2011_GWA1_36_9]|uniref:Uncharacterized protein n=1 Tax=Berkelbacteria bacterium GW2011_GWA1_36_9 TaxID=1618331 RepID=A0A0G0FIJ5_9BACT|nr:MAG: hypothetical protein US31_C0017G0011 [Berkelbacteria bacterium GW2011_GWA1_36_9]